MELIVLKGIKHPNRAVDFENTQIFENKFLYFQQLMSINENTVTYEEFIILKDFFQSQYQVITIKSDNRFIYHYPIIYSFDEYALNQLVNLYDEELEEDDEKLCVNAEIYKLIFSNVTKIDSKFYVTYQDDFLVNSQNNINYEFTINNRNDLHFSDLDVENAYQILTEFDYIRLIKKLEVSSSNEIYININGAELSRELLIEKLSLLNYEYNNLSDLYLINKSTNKQYSFDNKKYTEILNKHWKKDEFLDIDVYNLEKLDENIIETESISQDRIINDIYTQLESCIKGSNFRDIFVTAPTGSGKSAIFQIPAILIAERYNLMTLVISPLIGLMSDQIDNLENKGYKYARTINSDISPILKSEIIHEIQQNKCHILYLSPESLMAKSDLSSLIGDRTLGMIVIDESHIVTTWGKQFRPDYWYLGDHIQHLRKNQLEHKQQSFVISTFTATAIYRGLEDMFGETKSSLQLINPITYLGKVKRSNIEIEISEVPKVTNKQEYEDNKFMDLVNIIKKSLMYNRKILIYFPTIPLINRFNSRCIVEKLSDYVTCFYGGMEKGIKTQSLKDFKNGSKLVMLATKAFGMGIDIDDISDVVHFAPTGNVCDYVQEVGRAARKREINGRAIYHFMSNDFKHINKLHGMSTVRDYQLVKVMEKILELYNIQLKNPQHLKKQNSLLIDAENFSYIFEKDSQDEESSINKVKTALLLIQKDFQYSRGYTPFRAKPIPLFSQGYFHIPPNMLKEANKVFNGLIYNIPGSNYIYSVNLKEVWESNYNFQSFSFPQFKYFLYTKDERLPQFCNLNINPALEFTINFQSEAEKQFSNIFTNLQHIINKSILDKKYISADTLSFELSKSTKLNVYQSKNIIDIFLSSIQRYKEYVSNNLHHKLVITRPSDQDLIYSFTNSMDEYFYWLNKEYKFFKSEASKKGIYLINSKISNIKGKTLALGILESFNVLTFKVLGGANSQIYIYVNQTQSMYNIIKNPQSYKNRILKKVNDRHRLSVLMMSHLFSNKYKSNEIWDKIEEYFLGRIPLEVLDEFNKKE